MKKITLLVAILFATFSINAQMTLIDEGFDDITTLTDYLIVNVSDDPNTDIFQGNPGVFPAFDGEPTAYLGANFNTTLGSVIDLYIMSPELTLKNGDIISFYTRTSEGSTFPDRLEVRLDPDGTGTDPTSSDNGSYTELLLEINPNLEAGGYPNLDWEQQTITVSGLSGEVTTRFAFRYWVTDGGPTGNNSNFIGIDRLIVDSVLSTDEFSTTNFTHFYDTTNSEVRLNASVPMQNVTVFNALGQEVVNKSLSNTEETVSISNLSKGLYISKVTIGNTTETFKFIRR